MNTTSHPTTDREALSALFDGELAGDAARFALKRLDHDQDWRDSCERWQRVGNVLRGNAGVLPMTVAHMPAAVPARTSGKHATGTHARRWGTVALAASAAVVAFFLARLPLGGEATSTGHAPVVATAAAITPAQRNVALVDPAHIAKRTPHAPSAPAEGGDPSVAQFAGASVALATASRQASQRARAPQRTQRGNGTRIDDRAPVTAEAGVDAVATRTVAPTGVLAAAPPATPFEANAARPWPRAVLPQYSGNAALSADYEQAPSFYPFVPRVPVDAGVPAANDDAPAP